MKKFLSAALLSLLAACATVSAPVPQVDPARLSEHVRVLASDAFEGRAPATAGEEKTVAYLIEQFRAVGVQPGGDLRDGVRTWTQDVPLARFALKAAPVTTVTVGGETVSLKQGDDIAIRAAQTNVDSVTLKDAPLVFLGYGVRAPERNWDDYKGQNLKGAVGMVLINDPDFETGVGDFGGKAMTWYGRWPYKYEEAAKHGLAGLLIVHETAPASYGWPTVANSNVNAQFDIVREDPSALHPPVEAWITREVAVDLMTRAGQDFEALKTAAQSRDFQPVSLDATFSTAFDVDHDVIVSKNVVGLVPGKARPNETVIYTAHWDHLGVGQPDANGDAIYNGAYDNGAGVANLLELARLFAQTTPPPDRSVVFLAVTAEEKGLLGSEYYAAHPLYPLATTVANINMDGVGVNGRARDMFAPGQSGVTLQDELAERLRASGRRLSPDPRPEAGMFYRSDHFSLAKRGVPAISVKSGVDLVNGGVEAGRAASADYTARRYHQPDDEWSPDWDLSGQVEDTGLLYRWGLDLANSTRWPGWHEGSEFKAIRDETASARR